MVVLGEKGRGGGVFLEREAKESARLPRSCEIS